MGYILKKGTGNSGGGDATKANQEIQINQLLKNSGENSVFKESNDQSVFIDENGDSVFLKSGTGVNLINLIWLVAGNIELLLNKSTVINANIQCISFVAANPAALQVLVEAFLVTIQSKSIVNISYSEILATHTCYIVYQ